MNIKEYMKSNILLFDGAMGTMLQQNGLKIGENSDVYGFENPQKILSIHKQYLNAGANVITTNTFCSNEINLDKAGYSVEKIIKNSVNIAKLAIESTNNSNHKYIALDVGPIGKFLEPNGELDYNKAYDIFKRQIVQGKKSGVDLILIETMMDMNEAKTAIKVAKENTDLPVFCTMTFEEGQKTYMKNTPQEMVYEFEKLGVDALGVNCSLGPKQLIPIIDIISNITTKPIMVKPNAGLPEIVDEKAIYNITPEEFYYYIEELVKYGATIVGGCCGTSPEFINLIYKNINLLNKNKKNTH